MSSPFEAFHKPNQTSLKAGWESSAAASAFADDDSAPVIDSTTLAGIGVLIAGMVVVAATHGNVLKNLGQVIKAFPSEFPHQGGADPAHLTEKSLERIRDIDYFVFDLDRTLIDYDKIYEPLRRTLSKELTRLSGLPSRFINRALDQTQARLESPYFYNRLDEIRLLQERFPGIDLNEKFAEASVKAKAAFYDALKASPETIEMLQYLKDQGKSLHVFTAGSPTRTLAKLQGAGLSQYFDRIFTAGSNQFEDNTASRLLAQGSSTEQLVKRLVELSADAKSDGHGYRQVASYLRARPNRIAMTGDSPDQDIAPAKALGIFTAEARWYRNTPSKTILPDLELVSPAQLTDTLKRAYEGAVQK